MIYKYEWIESDMCFCCDFNRSMCVINGPKLPWETWKEANSFDIKDMVDIMVGPLGNLKYYNFTAWLFSFPNVFISSMGVQNSPG